MTGAAGRRVDDDSRYRASSRRDNGDRGGDRLPDGDGYRAAGPGDLRPFGQESPGPAPGGYSLGTRRYQPGPESPSSLAADHQRYSGQIPSELRPLPAIPPDPRTRGDQPRHGNERERGDDRPRRDDPLRGDDRPRRDERQKPVGRPEPGGDVQGVAARSGNGHVPSPERLRQAPEQQRGLRNEDEEMTRPLPVILPGANSVPRPPPVEAPRGPFEAARPSRPVASQPPSRTVSVTGSVEPPSATFSVQDGGARPGVSPAAGPASPASPATQRDITEAAAAKLSQIRDLYLTAEAIGEDALTKHFEQVSQRQRELIKEFFDKSGPADGPA